MRRLIVRLAHRDDFRYPPPPVPPIVDPNLIKTYTVGAMQVVIDEALVNQALIDLQEHHYQSIRGTALEQRMPKIQVVVNDEYNLTYEI